LFLTSWATSGVYDYVREPSNHVIEIIPLRRTFPDVSMEFMKSAFVKAAKGNITEDLIFSELQQFFKIDKKQATLLWKNLSENQKSIKGKTIEDKLKQTEKYLQSAKENLNALKEIKVNSNQTNFEQLLLQQQIKVHYLKQRQIGFVIEMTGLNKKLSQEISELRDELKQIDQNYLLLFQNDFDIRSLKEDCESRSQNLNALIKLAKISE
jgi:lysine/ornithine N-monooxygenase